MKSSIILIVILIFSALFGIYHFFIFEEENNPKNNFVEKEIMEDISIEPTLEENKALETEKNNPRLKLGVPLDKAGERVTKKPFGISITRENSPVKPEKFSGYHTGVDFEIFPDELEIDVNVRAVCDGRIIMKDRVNGYGGVLIQVCKIDNQEVSVLYGHLSLDSIEKRIGDNLSVNEQIGNLGKDKSVETDGERKHLHLGIHKGSNVNYAGYVSRKEDLNNWLDPCQYFCK